jgi:hypothetical protein
VDEVAEFFGGEIEESGSSISVCESFVGEFARAKFEDRRSILVKVDSTVRELAERSLLLELYCIQCQPMCHPACPASTFAAQHFLPDITNCGVRL